MNTTFQSSCRNWLQTDRLIYSGKLLELLEWLFATKSVVDERKASIINFLIVYFSNLVSLPRDHCRSPDSPPVSESYYLFPHNLRTGTSHTSSPPSSTSPGPPCRTPSPDPPPGTWRTSGSEFHLRSPLDDKR